MKNRFFPKLLMAIIFVVFSISPFTTRVFAADSKDVVLLDDFNRDALGVTGNGGEYNTPNSAGVGIYWIQMNDNTKAVIENNALKITMKNGGWYGEGVAFKDPQYKYIIMKIKGEKGGEEKLLTLNPDAKGLKNFSDLKGPDGKPIGPITKDYQNIVIDIQKSGFTLPNGFEAIHFNNTGALTVYIDEIYLSKSGVPVDLAQVLAAQSESEASSASGDSGSAATEGSSANAVSNSGSSSESSSDITTAPNASADPASLAASPNDSGAAASAQSTTSNKPVLIGIIILIMALLIATVVYNSFIRKPASGR